MDADELLFTYGTLRHPEVQLDTFGRLLDGDEDVLAGYTVDYAEIADPHHPGVSGRSVLPVLRATGSPLDKVVGATARVTAEELDACDEHEMTIHRRVSLALASGRTAWVYVGT